MDHLPVPEPNEDSRAFWQAAREHRLLAQRCEECGSARAYPQAACPVCLSERAASFECSGRGRIHTFTTIARPPLPAFAALAPYTLALIELEEGIRLLSEVKGSAPSIGAPVRLVFEDRGETSLPKFELVE